MPGAPLRINELGRRYWTPFSNLCAYSVPAFEKRLAVEHFLDASRCFCLHAWGYGSDRDLLDWLKFVQSETTGIRLGFSRGEVAEIDATIHAAWQESVEAEAN